MTGHIVVGVDGFAGLLLGSVSQQRAHHAPGPVVLVPRSWSLTVVPVPDRVRQH